MIGSANGRRIGITGLGVNVPEQVFTNKDLEQYVDTTDEWIVERTGIRERRFATKEEALTDIAAPAAIAAMANAGVDAASIDLIVVATVTPDMMFPTSSALLADSLGMPDAAAYDLLAGCTGFMYAVAQAYSMVSSGLSKRALVVGGDVLSKILDWHDRSTLVLFGDGAGAVVVEPVEEGGFLGFELGADGGGGENLWLPGSGSRYFEDGDKLVKMNGREVFKFATRVMVSSAQKVLDECGLTVDDIDVYVPHQANKRIIDHAAGKLGIPEEKVVVNVDRYGNTSSGSIPLALADAAADGRLREGELVLMTGMGAGLTWGSALIEWNQRRSSRVSKIAFMFPGQGSYEAGMGRDVAEAVPEAMAVYEAGSAASGLDLKQICFHDPIENLLDTKLQQPALVATSLAINEAIRAHGIHPDFVVGHSVGEFAALGAAESIGAADAIGLVTERGIAMAEAAQERPGSMAAILGLADEVVEGLCRKISNVWPANYNCPGQIVISGEDDAVGECCTEAEREGARRAVRLRVSGRLPLAARRARGRQASAGGREDPLRRSADGVHVHGDREARGRRLTTASCSSTS